MIALSTVIYDGVELVPHFIKHYAALGVDAILLAAHERVCHDVLHFASGYPAFVFPFRRGHFDCMQKHAMEKTLVNFFDAGPDDYIIYCDIDEFQEYPAPLKEIVRIMDERNLWALRGYFLDRLAADGRLPAVRPAPDIFLQYPIRCRLTRNLLHASDQKIMICRGRVDLNSGHHDTFNAYYDAVPVAGDYVVHHFKWTNGLLERMRARLAIATINPMYAEECRRTLALYDPQRGFDLSDSRIGIIPTLSLRPSHPSNA
ncbi:MAG: hypothetical protein ACLP9L_28630 [Thermoguttaceae bacterium]